MHLNVRSPAFYSRGGFTLIEISIVLVIIGLITGSVLVGKELIRAAELRAIISKYDELNTALNTFRIKYNAVPGDLTPAVAAQMGFTGRSGATSHGDGDLSLDACSKGMFVEAKAGCEVVLVWSDLSFAHLMSGNFTTATDALATNLTADIVPLYFPAGKRNGSFFTLFSMSTLGNPMRGETYFALAGITGTDSLGAYTASALFTPLDIQSIDIKLDDGIYFSGKVRATDGNAGALWSLGGVSPNGCAWWNPGMTQFVYNVTNTIPSCAFLLRATQWPS